MFSNETSTPNLKEQIKKFRKNQKSSQHKEIPCEKIFAADIAWCVKFVQLAEDCTNTKEIKRGEL